MGTINPQTAGTFSSYCILSREGRNSSEHARTSTAYCTIHSAPLSIPALKVHYALNKIGSVLNARVTRGHAVLFTGIGSGVASSQQLQLFESVIRFGWRVDDCPAGRSRVMTRQGGRIVIYGMTVAQQAPFTMREAYIAEPAAEQLMGQNVTCAPPTISQCCAHGTSSVSSLACYAQRMPAASFSHEPLCRFRCRDTTFNDFRPHISTGDILYSIYSTSTDYTTHKKSI